MKSQWRKDMVYEIISIRKKKNPCPVFSHADAFNLVKQYQNLQKEQCVLITLNAAYKPISVSIISIGAIDTTVVRPREVFIRAFQDKASSIIICHNHLSGYLVASPEDKKMAERMYDVGEFVGIRVLDSIIFSKDGYASLRKDGYIRRSKKMIKKLKQQ